MINSHQRDQRADTIAAYIFIDFEQTRAGPNAQPEIAVPCHSIQLEAA